MNTLEEDCKDLTLEIERLSQKKDECIKAADYPQAAQIRDVLDAMRNKRRIIKKALAQEENVQEVLSSMQKRKDAKFVNPVLADIADDDHPQYPLNAKITPELLARTYPDLYTLYIAESDVSLGRKIAYSADIVMTKQGTVLKDRYGLFGHPSFRVKALEPVVPETTEQIERALEKLSGTLSHDNVAAAKQILKDILG